MGVGAVFAVHGFAWRSDRLSPGLVALGWLVVRLVGVARSWLVGPVVPWFVCSRLVASAWLGIGWAVCWGVEVAQFRWSVSLLVGLICRLLDR